MTSGKTPPTDWLETANQFQQNLIQQWTQVAQAFPGAAAAPKAGANDPFAAFKAFMPQAGVAHPFGMPMPQMGQLPGPICRTCGCIGQVYSTWPWSSGRSGFAVAGARAV